MSDDALLRLSNHRVNDRVAVVTGAGRGMGAAFARILAANGAAVAVSDINGTAAKSVASEIVGSGGRAEAFQVDVSSSEQVKQLIRDLAGRIGPPEILVNNAGLLKTTSFGDISGEEWDAVMRVNIDGVFHCCKHTVPYMIERKYGKIINVSSTAGKSASTFGGLHYTASKAAVLGMTRHLARELAPHGINVNAVCPGSIDTPMIRENSTPATMEAGITKIPWGRLGRAEEVANLVLFLASDASSFITGASIDINGGELLV